MMQLNPYLFYNDNCEAAFKFYEKALGGKIEMMLRADEGPADMKPGPGREKLIMHARISIDGHVLMASLLGFADGERSRRG
jgi:PhnB protein